MKKTKSRAEQITETRIQSAVCGFRIPMMSIPALYDALEIAVASGSSDADLKGIVFRFPGVEDAR
jgi:hypothetical protein